MRVEHAFALVMAVLVLGVILYALANTTFSESESAAVQSGPNP